MTLPVDKPVGTIVVADDQEDFCRQVEEALTGEPIRILLARDAAEALRLVERELPELVLVGTSPGLDGFLLCRRLKGRKKVGSIPVVLVCSQADDETQVLRGFREGADDLLRRPMSTSYLKSKIRVWMVRGGHRRED